MVISPVNCNGWFGTTLTPRRRELASLSRLGETSPLAQFHNRS
jgi:hypothetical protein